MSTVTQRPTGLHQSGWRKLANSTLAELASRQTSRRWSPGRCATCTLSIGPPAIGNNVHDHTTDVQQ